MAHSTSILVKKFTDAANKVETTVFSSPHSSESIIKILRSIIGKDERVIVSAFRFLDKSLLNGLARTLPGYNPAPDARGMASAAYGITDSFAGVADTGSVCVINDDTMSGSYSLFPANHIVLLDSRKIVARPRDIFTDSRFVHIVDKEDFLFISGSSATADMGPLVRGVHGPARLYVIILK